MMRKEKSCGSILYRYKGGKRQFLLIHQLHGDFVGFPKGHQEKNEQDIETAVRETYEETNIKSFLYDNIKTSMRYYIRNEIDKEVVLYLGIPLSNQLLKQDSEVKHAIWVNEDDVLNLLTHQNTKDAFVDIHQQFKNTIEYQMPIKLIDYLYNHVLVKYQAFDQAHQYDHVHHVLKTSLELAKQFEDLKLDLVYVIAFYHDIGNLFGRDQHHITGAKYLEEDQTIQNYFNKDDIKIMKEAIEDHRASHDDPPRSIYGKIIAEADRDIVPEVIVKRTVQFGLSHYPSISKDQHINRAIEHINEKYGRNGYLKLWLDSKKNVSGLEAIRKMLENKEELYKTVEKYYDKYKKS
jgi:uncharacterized protein